MKYIIAWIINHLPITSVKKQIFFQRMINYLLKLCSYFNTQSKNLENENA